jgi:cell division protein FtsW (lipid II flippase)
MLSIFSGIALFPAGWHRYGIFKVNYIVPSIAFVILGTALMVFSMHLVPFSLAQFVRNWWPLLLALAGLTLVLVSVCTKTRD